MWNAPKLFIRLSIALCLAGTGQMNSYAGLITYTSRAAFDAAGPSVSVIDFESFPAANVASGSSQGGITFSYNLGSVSLKVVDSIVTTSGSKSLGTDDRDMLQDGDGIDLSFSARQGLGFYIVSRDALLDGDVRLAVNGTVASLSASGSTVNLGEGGLAWFLGIRSDDASTFVSATVSTHGGGGQFNFNLDDIAGVLAVPEPTSSVLLVLSAVAFARFRTRRP